jgi:hypothetical protein
MGVEAFDELARRHGLSRADGVAPAHLMGGDARPGALAGGLLPGGMEGLIVERTRTQSTNHGGRPVVHTTSTLVTRFPESTIFLPQLSCRDERMDGFADRLVGPGGLIPLMDSYEFESIELNRKYRIGALKGISENRIRQLFAPTFIDFLATRAPEGMLFELFGGILSVTAPGPAEAAEDLERLCDFANEVGRRVVQEAQEMGPVVAEESIPPEPPPQQPPPKRGLMSSLLHKVAGTDRIERETAELKAAIASRALASGRTAVAGAGPNARGIALGLPGRVLAVVRGGGAHELFVIESGVGEQGAVRPVAVLTMGGEEAGMLAAAAAAGDGGGGVVVGGFPIADTGGAVVLGNHDRAAAARVESLFGDMPADQRSWMGALTSDATPARLAPARDWLLGAGADRALYVSGPDVALVGPGAPMSGFDAGRLDAFEAEVAPAVTALLR